MIARHETFITSDLLASISFFTTSHCVCDFTSPSVSSAVEYQIEASIMVNSLLDSGNKLC